MYMYYLLRVKKKNFIKKIWLVRGKLFGYFIFFLLCLF